MRRIFTLIGLCCVTVLPGCATGDTPLIFGRIDTLGLSASATAPDQGGTASLGYRSAKVAVVPVTTRDANGHTIVLLEHRGAPNTGAFSTFAQFEASVAAVPGARACLGDTFATGIAAQAIAQRIDRACK